MPVNYNPKIVSAGLVASWDGGNLKSCDPRENLTTQSQNFSAWSAPGENTWTSAQTAAPDGTLTGWKGTNNSAANNFNFFWQQINTTVGGLYTNSVYIKNIDLPFFSMLIGVNSLNQNAVWHYDTALNSLYPVFDPGGNSVVSQSVTDVGNGWKRLSVTANATNLAANASLTIANVSPAYYLGKSGETSLSFNKSAFVWGTQFERNLTASTYIATTTSQYAKSTTLTDVSGNGNNLTTQNYPAWSKDFGGFFRTQTDGHWLGSGTTTLPLRNSQYTLSCWARFPTTWRDGVGYMSLSDMASINFQANYLKNVSGVGIFANNWWANNLLTTSNLAGIEVNKWFMVTATYDGITRKIYGNTTLLASDVPTQNHNVVNSSIRLARGWGNEWLNGDLGPAYIYNKALSSAEVLQNYNAQKSRFGL
jgi:hypothetical protein